MGDIQTLSLAMCFISRRKWENPWRLMHLYKTSLPRIVLLPPMKTLHIQLFPFLGRWACYWLIAHDAGAAIFTEHKLVYPMHSETKWYRNIGVWSRERFITGPFKEMDGSYLKTPKLLEGFQQVRFIGKVREGHGCLLQTSWCQTLCSFSCPRRSGYGQVTTFL